MHVNPQGPHDLPAAPRTLAARCRLCSGPVSHPTRVPRRSGATLALLFCAVLCAGPGAAGGAGPDVPPLAWPTGSVRVIAHRGASAYAPENTLPAIALALEQGSAEVELDVQLSRDGVAVLFHDPDLREKTGVPGAPRDHDASFLRTLDVGSWFDAAHPDAGRRYAGTTLTTLDEVFRSFGARPFYHLELKSDDPALAAEIARCVAAHDLAERVLLTSFDPAQLARVRERAPQLPRGWLLDRASPGEDGAGTAARHASEIDRAAAAGHRQVAVAASELTPELVARARDHGLEIRAWKVRELADWRRVLDVGADGGTVDWPDLALAELERRRR